MSNLIVMKSAKSIDLFSDVVIVLIYWLCHGSTKKTTEVIESDDGQNF